MAINLGGKFPIPFSTAEVEMCLWNFFFTREVGLSSSSRGDI
jgi:hypothetical protein